MKKFISCLLLLTVMLTVFASCGGDKTDDGLTAAKDYVYAKYKDNAEATPSDYEVIGSLLINDVSYTVEWTVEVSSGAADGVKVVAGEGNSVTIDVDEKAAAAIVYVLKGTVKDAGGKSLEVTFNHTVPEYKELSYAEYVAAADDTTVVVKGVITGIMAKSKGNSYNCLYLQDSDGGYYVYSMGTDPVTDDKLAIGMTVRVTGARATYSGTYEITGAAVEIVDSNITAVTPADYTEAYKSAKSLKDAALVEKQSLLVTLKGVEITGEDEKNGYYKFKLGELESYARISSSVCPLTKDEQTAFKTAHAEHLGWIANVTGVICLFDGAFYLTPVTAEAFEYVSLPTKTDAEMAAFEKENLTLPEAITADTVIELIAAGQSYTQVAVTWASDNACAVIADGKLTVTLPEADATVKITATIKCGSTTETREFTIAVDAAPTDVYIAKPVEAPVKDTAYKFAFKQVNLGQTLYFSGAMSGNYFATTDKADKATDVYAEEVTGGYRLYFLDGTTKKYLDIYEYTAGKVGVQITEIPTATYTFDTTLKIFVAKVLDTDYYLGTYNNYNTISASKTSYITGDNASKVGVSQFVAQLSTLAPAQYKTAAVDTPVKDTAYKFALKQVTLGQTLYFSGAMSGNYFATTDKAAKATDVYAEEVTGGYRLYFLDGTTKKYLDIYEYTTGKVGVQITDKPTATYTFDTTLKIFVAKVLDTDYYLGTYNNYNTISASKTSYITGDNASKVGVSQFVAQLSTLEIAEVAVTVADAPAKDTAYKFSLNQAKLGQTLYFSGAMNGNYFATTDKISKAADVYLEEVTGGYRLYFLDGTTKKYLDIYEYTTGKVGVQITDKPTATFVFDTASKIFTAKVLDTDYYLGTYNTYNTISASKTSYITGDKAADVGVSQFPAQLVTISVK